MKRFRFSWSDVPDADRYKLLENPDGVSGFVQIGSDMPRGRERIDHVLPLYARANARYVLQSCTEAGCVDSNAVSVSGTLEEAVGYVKASTVDEDFASDLDADFGHAVSLSADGTTLAVGAPWEDSGATGVNGDENDNSAVDSGAVYVFVKTDAGWRQQAYVKASNAELDDPEPRADEWGDFFGRSVSLSADGNTLAVGAPWEDSIATGVDGDQNDNSAARSGAVYVFVRRGGEWSQQAYVKASNTEVDPHVGADEWGDFFGCSVSLGADGDTLAVGAWGEDSGATGVDGDQHDNRAELSGAAYVFERVGGQWRQQAYLKQSNTHGDANFGSAVSLSADADTLAIGASGERSAATGIDGIDGGGRLYYSGAVYVFVRSDGEWRQQAHIKASDPGTGDYFGGGYRSGAVDLSADGDTLAVGASGEPGSASVASGERSDDSAVQSGAVYVFVRNGGEWSQQARIRASNADPHDNFGNAVSLSARGNTLAVGAWGEDSSATGVNGDQSDNSGISGSLQGDRIGAVYVLARAGGEWRQQAYVKASNSDVYDTFGYSVSLDADGATLAVGNPSERSTATGIGGDHSDNSVYRAGAVYLY